MSEPIYNLKRALSRMNRRPDVIGLPKGTAVSWMIKPDKMGHGTVTRDLPLQGDGSVALRRFSDGAYITIRRALIVYYQLPGEE